MTRLAAAALVAAAALGGPTYYSGPGPESEPETRAAIQLIRRIRPAVTVWYHQYQDVVDMAGGDRGAVGGFAVSRHLQAVAAMELGQRTGSRTGCTP